jgi:hypothetical protein
MWRQEGQPVLIELDSEICVVDVGSEVVWAKKGTAFWGFLIFVNNQAASLLQETAVALILLPQAQHFGYLNQRDYVSFCTFPISVPSRIIPVIPSRAYNLMA